MRSRQRWRTRHFVPGWSKWLWKYKSLLVEGKEPELLSEVPESYSWAHLRAQPAFWKHCPGDGAGFCSSVRVRGRYTCVLPVRCTGVSPVDKRVASPHLWLMEWVLATLVFGLWELTERMWSWIKALNLYVELA